MNFKLFGLVWDLRPILIFLWCMVALGLISMFFANAFANNHLMAIIGFGLCMLWSYITHTVIDNKVLDLED